MLITIKVQGDTAKFRQALSDRADEFAGFAERAKAAGAIHHQFAIGDGFVLVVDEWEEAHQFESFFGSPELQAFIAEVGAAPGPPEIAVAETVDSADKF